MLTILKDKWKAQSSDVRLLGQGLFWTIFGSVTSKGLLFLAWILIARILGKDYYGEYGLIRNTIIMFATFAGSGMGQAALKFVAEFYHKDRGKSERIGTLIFNIVLGIGIVIFLLSFFLSQYIADTTLKAPWLATDFRIASLVLLFVTVNTVQIGILEGLGKFKKVAVINLWYSLISLPLFCLGAYYGSVTGSIIAYGISILILCLLSGWQINRINRNGEFSLFVPNAWQEKKLIFSFILPAILSGITFVPLKWVTDVMLVKNAGFGEMGIFTAALTINIILLSIANTFNSPFLNVIAKNKGADNIKMDKLNVFAPWCIGIIMILPFTCFYELGAFLFGKEYSGEIFNRTFIIVLFFTLIMMYKQGFSRLFVLHNLQWLGLLSNTLWGVCLVGSFVSLKIYGSVGLALAYMVSYIVTTIMFYPFYIKRGYLKKYLIISPFIITVWVILVSLNVLVFIGLDIYVRSILFLLIYPLLLFLFYKEMRKDESKIQ